MTVVSNVVTAIAPPGANPGLVNAGEGPNWDNWIDVHLAQLPTPNHGFDGSSALRIDPKSLICRHPVGINAANHGRT
jgi:hypothetical protein